jgi:hypothetical protein
MEKRTELGESKILRKGIVYARLFEKRSESANEDGLDY